MSWEDDRLTLPEKTGRKELVAKTIAAFLSETEPSYLGRLGLVLRDNLSPRDRWGIWQTVRKRGDAAFLQASCLGLFFDTDLNGRRELIRVYGHDGLHALISFGHWDRLSSEDRDASVTSLARTTNSSAILLSNPSLVGHEVDLYRVYVMLNPFSYSSMFFEADDSVSFEVVLTRYGLLNARLRQHEEERETNLYDVTAAAVRGCRTTAGQWRTSMEPWSDFIESARRTWGDGAKIFCLAAISAGIVSKSARAAGFDDVFNEKLPLVERARCARLKTAASWWKRAVQDARTPNDNLWIMTLLLAWGPGAVIKSMLPRLTKAIKQLDDDRWGDLFYSVRTVASITKGRRQSLAGFDEVVLSTISSERLKAFLLLRLPKSLSLKVMIELLENFDGQDRYLALFLEGRSLSESARDPKIWKSTISFLKNRNPSTFRQDVYFNLRRSRSYYSTRDLMPYSVAIEVAQTPEGFPLHVLEAAETSLSRRPRSTLTTLGSVALEQRWFNYD